jgi:hypothetical protein
MEKEIEREKGAHVSLRRNQCHLATQLMAGALSRAGLRTLLDMLGEEGHVRTGATNLLRNNKNKNNVI